MTQIAHADRRNGVGVEDFHLLDIRRDRADEVAAVLASSGGIRRRRPQTPR